MCTGREREGEKRGSAKRDRRPDEKKEERED